MLNKYCIYLKKYIQELDCDILPVAEAVIAMIEALRACRNKNPGMLFSEPDRISIDPEKPSQ